MVSNERYSASSSTGLYVLMNEFRMCCSIGLFAAAAKSSQSAGSCSTMFIVVLRTRSEEHTSELQSLRHLVCRLLLEKKKHITITNHSISTSSSTYVHRHTYTSW